MSLYQPQQKLVPYGLHVPYDKGYDAQSKAKAHTADQRGASASFSRVDGTTINMWVTDVVADFSISGQTGQSRMQREFFPRSFNDVTITITGNVASTQEYNRLGLFVREAHYNALGAVNQGLATSPLITFSLFNTYGPKQKQPYSGKRNVKGPHKSWIVSGYIQSMKAGAVRWEVAPEFSINFIVATSTLTPSTGIWSDTLEQPTVLKNVLQLLNVKTKNDRIISPGYVQNPISGAAGIGSAPAKSPTPTIDKKKLQNQINQTIWSIAGALSNF